MNDRTMSQGEKTLVRVGVALIATVAIAACDQPEMADQPKYGVYEAAPAWPQRQSARRPPPGTVARGDPVQPRPDSIPMAVDRPLLERGRHRYDTFCAPCHGRTGEADGMVVQRGFPAPPSLHEPRLRDTSLAYFYDVISDGYGVMYAYGDRVAPADRWAIAAYVRALQVARNTPVDSLDEDQRARLAGENQ